jgi:energy-coupling factor transport system permease protein
LAADQPVGEGLLTDDRFTARRTSQFHALTFTAWALSAAVCVHAAPNAVYVTIVMLIAVLTVEVHRLDTLIARSFYFFVGIAAVFGALRAMLTVLTTHGIDRAMFTLPVTLTLPTAFGGFTVGGAVERSVVLHAFSESYAIVVFITVFAAWNAVVSHHEVLRFVPRAFHEPALIVTIAIAFVPATITSFRAIREAERARTGGVRARHGVFRRRLLPVLEGGLERAISLSESMDSRGYGHVAAERAERRAGWCALGGLALCAGGFVALVSNAGATAVVVLLAGLALIGMAVVIASRASDRVRYRPRRLRAIDAVLIAASLAAPVVVVGAAAAGDGTLHWSPSRWTLPPVNLAVVGGLLLLAAPAVVGLLSFAGSRVASSADPAPEGVPCAP